MKHTISLCTVIMNRLAHVRETLPANILHNVNCPGVEFVLLDYNSSDGLDKWVRKEMMPHIESGILKYYRTTEPAYFNISHSKNMAANLASGEIHCHIDGDNFIGPGYVEWIDSVFSARGKNALVVVAPETVRDDGDLCGRINCHRDLFFSARGFDESLAGYGMDDVDLASRLEKAGGHRVFIEDKKFLQYIPHPDIDRVSNYELMNKLDKLYIQVNEFSAMKTVVLYLLKDDTYCEATYRFDETMKHVRMSTMNGWYIEEGGFKKGKVYKRDGQIVLERQEQLVYRDHDGQSLTCRSEGKEICWSRIAPGTPIFLKLVFAYDSILNFMKFRENHRGGGSVNTDGWGKGTVFLNFDQSHPIACSSLHPNQPKDVSVYEPAE